MQSGHVSVAQVRGAPRVQSPLPIPAPLSSQLPQQQHPQMPPSSSPPPSPPSPSPPAPRSHPHLNIHSHHPQNPPHAYPRAHSHSHSYTNTQTHTRTSPRPRLDTTQQPPASTVSMTTPTANTTPTNSSSNPAPNSVPAPAPTSTSASTSSSSTAVLCDVCCEHVAPSSLRGCSACLHRYCLSCVEKYWTAAVYSGNHAHLLCMYGGCGIFASDSDVASVVSHRTFRKMLYFRSRDAFNHCPNARWCAVDLCWHYLGNFPLSVPNPSSSLHSSATPNNASISNSSSSLPRQFKTPSRSGDRHVVADESPALTSERRSKGGVHRPRYSIPSSASSSPIVACPRCSGKTCVACEREVTTSAPVHVCASRRSNKAHNALFTMWAMLHTKSCPACAARIQRNHGRSHMTCTRCSSYFCWRCKGFLNNGCPLPGGACICDRVMTAAAYSGLAVLGVVGSPVIVAALVVAGPPYLAYQLLHACVTGKAPTTLKFMSYQGRS